MSPGVHTERAFEDRVEYELLRRGWVRAAGLYSAEMGIYTGALWEFVGRTQVRKWNKLIELYGGDPEWRSGSSRCGWPPRSTRGGCSMCCGRG